jgi:DNA repair ATPase RecN
MDDSNRIVQLILLAAAAAIAAVAVSQLRVKRRTVEATAQGIHDQLDALDPITRAAVIARLTAGAVKDVRARAGRR